MKLRIRLGLFLFFFFLVSCKSKKQIVIATRHDVNYIPYYLKVYEADSLNIVGQYQKANEILDNLFKAYMPLDMDIYNEYLIYIKTKIILKKEVCDYEFNALTKKFGYTEEFYVNDSILSPYLQSIMKDYGSLRREYLESKNLRLRDTIKKMKKSDQLYRNRDYNKNIVLQNIIDSINSKKIIKIFEKYGFPNSKLIGNYAVDNDNVDIVAMLLHTKDSLRIHYLIPKIKNFVNTGESNPQLYANLIDQYNLYNSKHQYYGSYENPVNIKLKILNERRKTIGLPCYGYEKWRFKKLYPNFFN